MFEYRAVVKRVVDGDTLEVTIDLGFKVSTITKLRLARVDTPETYRPKSEAEREHGLEAKEFVRLHCENKLVTIKTSKTGKYGRWIAEVILPSGENLTDLLIENDLEKRKSYE